jgi:paraquat-inducible protein A
LPAREAEISASLYRALACPECDALLSVPRRVRATFHCPRCACVLVSRLAGSLDSAFALYIAATICFILANVFPILKIEAKGIVMDTALSGTALALLHEHMELVAVTVAATTVVIPAIELAGTTMMLAFAESHHRSRTLAWCFRLRQRLRPWNMVEIFMLGSLVAIVKLAGIASVVIGVGLWSIAAFMIAHAAASHVFDPKDFWNEVGMSS